MDQGYYRPSEVDTLLGSAEFANQKLGWRNLTTIEDLIDEMVASDERLAISERALKEMK